MKPQDNKTDTADRRRSSRAENRTQIVLRFETTELEGESENISNTGVLFFSDEELRVTVRVVKDGETIERIGHLVRAQRMHGKSMGWAVEYDRS